VRSILLEKRWIQYTTRQLDHYYTDLSGTFDDYLKKFSGRTRSELRRQLKVLKPQWETEPETQPLRSAEPSLLSFFLSPSGSLTRELGDLIQVVQ
jgi:hypothetical protein